jgi:hypothetical protein
MIILETASYILEEITSGTHWTAQPPVQLVLGLFSTVKRPGRGANCPLPSSAEVANGLELYVRLPSVPT